MNKFERQIPIFGNIGQQKIMSTIVGVIGCGGLGVNVITALAEAGINHFVLVDSQVPDVTNLNRQYIYKLNDSRPKVEIAAQWILELNPCAEVKTYQENLTYEMKSALKKCDILVDCLDSFRDRIILSDLSEDIGIPLIHGGVYGMRGQIMVCIPGITPCLKYIISTMKDTNNKIPSIGASVAIIGSMEALEVLKIISGLGTLSTGRLISINMKNWTIESINIRINP